MYKQEKDKKSQKTDFSIRKTFRRWLALQKIQNAMLLFGGISSGKSTICHLLIKVMDNVQDPNLKFVQKKNNMQVQYEGQINSKTTKSLTIYPKLTKIQKLSLNIIEVPSRIYSTQPKKRPYLDKLMHLIGLMHAVKNVKFIFAIDARCTSTKIETWIKAFKFIFDNFKTQCLDQDLFNSIGFIVTKGDEQKQKQVYLNRTEFLSKYFTKQKLQQYVNLINTVQKKQSLCTFKKITSIDQAVEQSNKICQFLKQLPYSSIFSKNASINDIIQPEIFQMTAEQNNCLNQFNDCLKPIITFFSNILKGYIEQQGKDNSDQDNLSGIIQAQIQKQYFVQLSTKLDAWGQNQSLPWSNVVLQRYSQLVHISRQNKQFYSTTLGKCKLLLQYQSVIQLTAHKEKPILRQFLKFLSGNSLILQRAQLKPIYLGLIEYALFEQRFSFKIKDIRYQQLFQEVKMNEIFQKTNRKICQKQLRNHLKTLIISGKQSTNKIQLIMTLLDNFLSNNKVQGQWQSEQIQNFQKIDLPRIRNCLMLNLLDVGQPRRDLPKIYSLINQYRNQVKLEDNISNRELSKRLALMAAEMLKNSDRQDLAFQIYAKAGKHYLARLSYQNVLSREKPQNQIQIEHSLMSYLELLGKMTLWQQAIKVGLEFAEKNNQLRTQILNKLKQNHKIRTQNISKQLQIFNMDQISELIQFYISQQLLTKIKQIVNQNCKSAPINENN